MSFVPPAQFDWTPPCPQCRAMGHGPGARIGNRRSRCPMCNRFAANSRRLMLNALIARHPDEVAQVRLEVERVLYAQIEEVFAMVNDPPPSDDLPPAALAWLNNGSDSMHGSEVLDQVPPRTPAQLDALVAQDAALLASLTDDLLLPATSDQVW